MNAVGRTSGLAEPRRSLVERQSEAGMKIRNKKPLCRPEKSLRPSRSQMKKDSIRVESKMFDDSPRKSLVSLASAWSKQDFEAGAMVFSMTELTTSAGDKRAECRDRYLEIQRFPTEEHPGKGKYFLRGEVRSVFTFAGGETGVFDSVQRNGRPFHLAPIVENDKPVGFVWTMPEEYPLFEAKFGLSEAARKELSEIRVQSRKSSAFGQFKNKRCSMLKRQQSKAKATTQFGAWQNRFAKKRHNIKLNLTAAVEEATLKVHRRPDGSFRVTVVKPE